MRGLVSHIAGVCLALAAASEAAAEPLDAKALLEPPVLRDVDLSPNGERLALISRARGGDLGDFHLSVAQADGEDLHLVMRGSDEVTPIWVAWATDERLLVAVYSGLKITGSTVYWPSSRIVSMNADGSDPVVLFEDERSVLRSSTNLSRITDILPEDPEHLMMPGVRGDDLDLWKVNIFTGEAERVALGGGNTVDWVTDFNGEPKLRIDANSSRTVTTFYGPPEDGDRNWRRIARVREEDMLEFKPLAAAEGPSSFYTAARPEGEDRSSIYIYDVATDTLGEPVASDPRVDISGVMVNMRTGAFAGYLYVDDRVEYRFADEKIQQHFDGLTEFFGKDVSLRIYDQSDDGRVWVVRITGPRDQGSYYVYDLDEARILTGYAIYEHPPEDALSATDVVRYPARDGLEITAYLTLPAGREPKDLPFILMPHGGPEMRDMLEFNVYAQFLASRGYAVLQPNFRGSSGYGRSFADAGRRQWGAGMQDDLIDGMDYLVEQGVIDPDRACILGASYGGYAALAAAILTPDRFRCIISIAGPSDLEDQLNEVRRSRYFDSDDYDYWVAHIGDPKDDQERLRAISPERLAATITAPVLLIHGEEDQIVSVDQSRDMARALERAGLPHEYVEFEDLRHSNWPTEQEIEALEKIDSFLQTHLPAE